MSCKRYVKVDAVCPCLFEYDDGCGNIGSINLCDAKVVSFDGGFNIFSSSGGLKVSDDSDFTAQDIKELICLCNSGGGGLTIPDPVPVTPSIGPIVCNEDGQLVFIDQVSFPPQAYTFDGEIYLGNVVPCEQNYKWVETEYCSDDGVTIRVICWDVSDPTGTSQTIWVLPDGTIADTDPGGLIPCEQICDPYINGTTCDVFESTEPFNQITINNRKACCPITVITSAGQFYVQDGEIACIEFECLLDPEITLQIDGECDKKDIVITTMRTK